MSQVLSRAKVSSFLFELAKADPCILVMAYTLETFSSEIINSIPLTRIGTPEDVAGTALFLAGRAGAYVNGALITLDGGAVASSSHIKVGSKL